MNALKRVAILLCLATGLIAQVTTRVTADLVPLVGRSLTWSSTVVELSLRNCGFGPDLELKAFPDNAGKMNFVVPSVSCGSGYYLITVKENSVSVFQQTGYITGSSWNWNTHRPASAKVDPQAPATEDDGVNLNINRDAQFKKGANFRGPVTIGSTVLAACGTADDTAEVTAALATANVQAMGVCTFGSLLTIPKGRKLKLPPGVHSAAGIRFSDSLLDHTGTGALECAGSGVSTIKLKNAANVDLISQTNFGTLTGTNSSFGAFHVSVVGCTLDGNKANQTGTSYVIRLYGHSMKTRDMVAQNGHDGGIWTEYGLDASFATPDNDLEASYTDVKSIFNGGSGWINRGPHDSQIVNYVSYQNAAWGYRNESGSTYNSSGTWLTNVNVFLNGAGGIYSNNAMAGTGIAATTAAGWGMLIDAGAGVHSLSAAHFAGPIGLEVRAGNQNISGNIANTTTTGLKFVGGGGTFHFTSDNNTGSQVDFTGGVVGGLNLVMSGPLIPGTMFNGTAPSAAFISMVFGGGPSARYASSPSSTLHSDNGYAPQLPQSNAVLAVMNDGAQTGRFIATSLAAGTCVWLSGAGSPEGAVFGSPCWMYLNTAGGAGATLWVKQSGTDTNTGWVAK